MTKLATDAVVKLMSQYTLEMDTDSINEGLSCTMCRKLMIDPYQTYCGCQYCRRCIVKYLEDGDKYCSGGKSVCKEEQLMMDNNVFKSAMLHRKILRARVHCPKQSCPCIVELGQMEEHLRLCTGQSIECPYTMIGCDNREASNEQILIHLQNETLIHSKLLMESFHNLKNEVNGLKDDLEASKLEISTLRDEMSMNEARREEEKRELIELMEYQKQEIIEQKTEIEFLKDESMTRENLMKNAMQQISILRKDVIKLEKNTKSTKDMSGENYQSEIQSRLASMNEEIDKKESAENVTQSMNDVREMVATLSTAIDRINVGTNTKVAVGVCLFTIHTFGAKKKTRRQYDSPYFYSHANGYKLELRVHPGGFSDSDRLHMSLFLVICKGEYDDILPWPCRHTFNIGIIDQYSGEMHTTDTLSYGSIGIDNKDVFKKPGTGDNDGYGYPTLISHSDMKSVRGLVVNDSFTVRCDVTAPT